MAFRTTLKREPPETAATEGGSVYGMQRKFGVITGAVALGFAGMFGVVPSAAAVETAGMGAQASAFYIYEHDDFNGRSAVFTTGDGNLTDNDWSGHPGSRNVNDNASSMKNQTDRNISLFDHTGCTGDRYLAKKNSEDKDLTNNSNNPSFDNRASCVRFD